MSFWTRLSRRPRCWCERPLPGLDGLLMPPTRSWGRLRDTAPKFCRLRYVDGRPCFAFDSTLRGCHAAVAQKVSMLCMDFLEGVQIFGDVGARAQTRGRQISMYIIMLPIFSAVTYLAAGYVYCLHSRVNACPLMSHWPRHALGLWRAWRAPIAVLCVAPASLGR